MYTEKLILSENHNMVQMSSNGTLFILLQNQIKTQMETEKWFFMRYLLSLFSSCKFDNFKDEKRSDFKTIYRL
jgi:hypothetical protein